MAGIFDLFNGTSNSGKQQFSFGPGDASKKSALASTNFGNIGGVAGKNVGLSRPKPKGLSIRSKSDLNVTGFNANEDKSPIKKSPVKGQYLKAEIGPFGTVSRQLFPRGRDKNSKIIKSKQLKALSSNTKSPDNISQIEKMQTEANVFRRPFTPKNNGKSEIYPEPEKLANIYNEENDSYSMMDNLDREFVRLVRLSRPPVKPFEDEGFESDPEFVQQPSFEIFNNSIEDQIISKSPSLPSISDDDDDFFN